MRERERGELHIRHQTQLWSMIKLPVFNICKCVLEGTVGVWVCTGVDK